MGWLTKNSAWKPALLIGVVIAGLVVFARYGMAPNPVGVPILRATNTTPSGIVLQLVQTRNPTISEPYTTSLYARAGETTYWFYIDHEDFWWHRAAMTLEPSGDVLLMRDGTPFARVDPARLELRILKTGRLNPANKCDRLPIPVQERPR